MPGPSFLEAPTPPRASGTAQNVCEEPKSRPLQVFGVKGSVQVIFADGFGVDYVGHTLHTLESLQSLQKGPRQAMLFPLPEGPTIIKPWLIWVI